MTRNPFLPGAIVLAAAGACATGSTLQSGVGDRLLEHPPFYTGARAADTGTIAHLAVAYQGEAAAPAAFLAELTAYLDSLGVTTGLPAADGPRAAPPDVQFNCETVESGACGLDEYTYSHGCRSSVCMRLAVRRTSREWAAWAEGALDSAGAVSLLLITLETGQYGVASSGFLGLGRKYVELGTAYTESVPWLTSEEVPVQVLQVTGALIGRDGRPVRIGAEGLLAVPTGLVEDALGLQGPIADARVGEARTARREDLPGRPLVWQVALRTLVTELTGRPAR